MTYPGKSNSVKARQTISSSASFEQDGCLSAPILAATLLHEESRLIHGASSLHFLTQDFSAEYELDELILPLIIQLLHSWTTFSGDLHASLLQQPGPRIYGCTFIPVF